MSQVAVTTYQRIKKERPQKSKKSGLGTILEGAAGFLFASAAVYDGLAPLGLSYLSKERSFGKRALLSAAFVITANLLSDNLAYAAKYIAAEAIYIAVLFVLERGIRLSKTAALATAAGALTLSGGLVLYWQGFGTAAVLRLGAEILIMLLGAEIFDKIKKIDFSDVENLSKLSPDRRFALVVCAGLLLMGAKRFYIGSQISVMNCAAALLLLVVAAGSGASAAAVFGLWTGFACGIETDFFMPLVGTFGFCGFLCGLFSRFGKGGCAVGLILANAVLIVYTNNAIEPMLKVYEILLGIAAFVFFPQSVILAAGSVVKITGGEKEKITELKKSIKQRLKNVSKSFKDMAETLEELSEINTKKPSEAAELFDRAADKICVNCRRSAVCWGRDFNLTYKALFPLFEGFEKNGKTDEADFGNYIKANCLNKEKLLTEINSQLELFKSELVWKSRLSESRTLACQQISGMSEIVGGVAAELDEEKPPRDFCAERISGLFKKNGVKIKDLSADESGGGMTASFLVKNSVFEKNGGEKLRRMLGRFSGRDFAAKGFENAGKNYKLCSYGERKRFYVETGGASAGAGASEANGDSYMFFELECGKFVVILSDGMGTGKNAKKESRAITELLNSFLTAGFNKKLALKLINTVMIMKSEKEEFATVDMCIIDLYTGEAEFLKSGAEPSYITDGKGVETITAKALPIGIIPDGEPESFKRNLKDGDLVFMATDGILSRVGGGEWIKDCIRENFFDTPDAASKKLLGRAAQNNGGEVLDDMTVVSVRLKKRSALKTA